MNAQFSKKSDAISRFSDAMQAMVSSDDLSAFFARQIYPMYQLAQKNRWVTENASENGQWRELNAEYVKYKKKKYAGYPGGGTKKVIATGKLVAAATGEGPGLNKFITANQMRLAIDLGQIPYAKYVANEFPIMSFGPQTIGLMKSAIASYIKARAR